MMRHKVLPALGAAAALLGLFLLYRIFSRQDLGAVAEAVASAPGTDLMLAGLFAVGSFVCIAAIEYLAVRYVRRPVSKRRVASTAVAAIGIGHAVGLAALSSGAIRYRMYKRAGLGIVSTGKIVMFSGVTAMCGFACVGGAALLWQASALADALDASEGAVRGIGIGALVVVAAYVLLCALSRRRIFAVTRRIRARMPSVRFAVAQVVFASMNVLCIGGALYACLRSFADLGYPTAAALYVSSDVAALVGHVPGGWGVLEYVVTSVLGESGVLAGLVLYRAIYYIVPLLVGLVVFLADEIVSRRHRRSPRVGAHPIVNAT